MVAALGIPTALSYLVRAHLSDFLIGVAQEPKPRPQTVAHLPEPR